MADSLNYLRSKHGWAQTNRFVLRWFNLNEAPKAARETGMTSTVSRRPPISAKPKRSQRAALKTKRRSLAMGVTKKGTENEKGLDAVRNTEMQEHAAVTVNLISTRAVNSDEEMEEIGEDPEGEEREAAGGDDDENEDQDHSDVESFDFFTESSSEVSEEAVLLPNILIPCTRCHDVINICRLPCHRNLHCALQTLKYAQDQRPKNISALVRRRKLLIKQQQDASSKRRQDPFGDKHLHKLNTAFEFLRTELQGTTDLRYLSERVIEEIKVTGESFDLSCSIAAGVCEEANKRWKYMEDVHIYKDNFLNNINRACFLRVQELTEFNIAFHVLLGEPDKVLQDFVKSKEIGGVVADFTPLRKPLKWVEDVAKKLPKNVPLCQLYNLSNHVKKIKKLISYLKKRSILFSPKFRFIICNFPKAVDWEAVDSFIDVDRAVKDVDWAKAGTEAGLEMLESFCNSRLKYFATDRNNPTKEALSNLSPWYIMKQLLDNKRLQLPQPGMEAVASYLDLNTDHVATLDQENIIIAEKVSAMFNAWKHAQGTNATRSKLVTTLVGVKRKDLAEKVLTYQKE
ncbi:uncharacterized protein LOC113677364 [Pocillopora damicornis]|nr:uncharacterized protein LOC113677364 [Pocillopora damicornis]